MPFVSSVEDSFLNRKKRPIDRSKSKFLIILLNTLKYIWYKVVIIDPSVQIKHINRHKE